MTTRPEMTDALPYGLESMLNAIKTAKMCEQASYVHLSFDAKQAVDMLIARGLVRIVNGIPRAV
jgi:hypothetical protein